MFTGLVRELGQLTEEPRRSPHGGVFLDVGHGEAFGAGLELGASLAVSGVCLTAVELAPGRTRVELSPETLARTTLGGLHQGSRVNLEPALRLGDALGGHWVQGHVDATTEVTGRRDLGDHRELDLAIPESLKPFFVYKGSVCVDGVSLTVAALAAGAFSVALIPHTLERTTLGDLDVGARVNLEVDVLAKYVHRALVTAGVVGDAPSSNVPSSKAAT